MTDAAVPVIDMRLKEPVEFLEQYFSQPEHQNDPDCFYPGIMYFELGWEVEDRQLEFFQRAKYWLERYRALSGGEEWDAIDDRLLDLDEYFEEHGIEVETPDDMPSDAFVETQLSMTSRSEADEPPR